MFPRLVTSDKKGRIIDRPQAAAGMKGGKAFLLERSELVKVPPGSRFLMLPHRAPIGIEPKTQNPVIEDGFAVAVFLPPGYTTTYNPAYKEIGSPRSLPLLSYAACALYKGKLHAAALRVDRERRHDSTRIDIAAVKKGVGAFKKIFPKNHLIPHLEKCALNYGCCGAQNFFLGKYEGPLPVSPSCNASCAGCISHQPGDIPEAQPRIKFTPAPEEVAEVALFHIKNAGNPVVSFGQGCEGEPLMAGPVIEKAIHLIRSATSKGTININTNASIPGLIARLCDAGLDSARVSMNSARRIYYARYYKPSGYSFEDVLRSIKIMKRSGKFVSINYLTMPGFTDTAAEFDALKRLISSYRIDMIQWRNLNFDPLLYFRILKMAPGGKILGIRQEIELLRKRFPKLMMGYFNPARNRIDKYRNGG